MGRVMAKIFRDKSYYRALYAALGLGRDLYFAPYKNRYLLRRPKA